MTQFHFEIQKRSSETPLLRAGTIHTPHGDIQTPAFITVGTKGTVKSLSPEMVRDTVGAQVVLANTYHLYLQPGADTVASHGGFAAMMNWRDKDGNLLPTVTDSGGFQVFSLGQALGHGVSKIATSAEISEAETQQETSKNPHEKLAKIDEGGVTFKSIIDGTEHRFTPEISMQIQHKLGADIFFAFDECTSPLAPKQYQIEALERTHRWAERSLAEHKRLGRSSATGEEQALFAVVQGGGFADLRQESAEFLGAMDFDGYGIGGSFTKEDMPITIKSVTEHLPEGRPRHLLGIGEPIDFFIGAEYGCDTFDCVAATRIARNGAVYSKNGRINIHNAKYKNDMTPLCDDPLCYAHQYTKSYVHHLFKAEEMFAATIASLHNLHFITGLVADIRQSILDDRFFAFKKEFLEGYYGQK